MTATHIRPAHLYTPEIDAEIRNRIRLSVYAYAYEFDDVSLVSDHAFDEMAKAIRPEVETGRPELDTFFRDSFSAYTGSWIHQHPERDKIAILSKRHYHRVVPSAGVEPARR